MKKLVLIIVLVLLVSIFLSADVYVKRLEKTSAFEIMGNTNPETVEVKEMWIGENKFAQLSKVVSFILDYEKEKLYLILHPQKSYFEFPTNLDREKLLAMLPPKAVEIVSSIEITGAHVNTGGPKKKIANWNCDEAEMEMTIMVPAMGIMPKYKIKFWTTQDLSFDYEKYMKSMETFFVEHILGILKIDEASKKELEKMEDVEGFQVAADITIMIFGSEIHVEMQVLEMEERPAPAGVYSVPKGYTKKTIDAALGIQRYLM